MAKFIEPRHELSVASRIADVRPWTTKFGEALSEKFWLTTLSVPLIVGAAVAPILAPFALGGVAAMLLAHRSVRPKLPLRYPAINTEPDPRTGKPGNGIMFFGNVDSTSPYEKFKELWSSDDDLRKHMLILGSTGSGKSEALKAIFFNALCWSSGYFVADGKADNKLPTDNATMVRSVGRDDDMLTLNFLLGGHTPEQVRRSRRRRTNGTNPFNDADADTIIQMGANMLPKVEGEGKNWQEKALNLWRAEVIALCYKRDTAGFNLSISAIIDYLALPKIEELYMEGYHEAQARGGEWSYGYISIKTYLETGCPGYKTDRLLAKHGEGPVTPPAPMGGRGGGKQTEQDGVAFEQHAYRSSQLMPVMNLLDKTYGHIFRDKFSEIDMVDVTLNNRIMTMLIPSLEKSSQEAENLGKLAIACLRVMMGRNLGAEIEGSRRDLLESKATNSPSPYIVALDELAYYFSDGLAVIFAQARSLGFSMIAAAQDLEKLTEGNRAAEAGAMLANQVTKIFLRIDDAKKTWEFIQTILQKVAVAVYSTFNLGETGWRRKADVEVREVDRVSLADMQKMDPGQGVINSLGHSIRFRAFYMDDDLKKHRADNFYVLRFLQVPPPSDAEVMAYSIPGDVRGDALVLGERLRSILACEVTRPDVVVEREPVLDAVAQAAASLGEHVRGDMRAIVLYQAARAAVLGQATAAARQPRAMPALGASALDSSSGGAPGGTSAGETTAGGEEAAGPLARLAAAARGGARAAANADPEVLAAGEEGAAGVVAEDMSAAEMFEQLLPLPFERKPIDDLVSSGRAEGARRSQVQERMVDPVDSFLSGMRFFNMPKVVSVGPGESAADAVSRSLLDAEPTANAGAGQAAAKVGEFVEDESWIKSAMSAAQAPAMSRAGVQPNTGRTAVGFRKETLEGVSELEQLLGSEQPVASARKLEAVVSAQVTPVITPDVEPDKAAIDALFDDIDETFSKGQG